MNKLETGSAIWVKLPANVLGGLKIGYQVNAWSNGIIAESMPRQTTGIQVQVVSYETGNADVKGKVTALNVDKADQTSIEVDGQKYVLQLYTKYWLNNSLAQLQDIQLEDKVEVWLTGYGDRDDIAAQVKVER
ncbi:hypothetical protein SD71_12185 [Cohnella kolymensis]|uniref:DUF5666 domain-containing protein n=1 Tax=Cohnella kolymensis TaxID=1590652 RepID=A0ABR5A5C5_9BACL|nr:DUF3221 domain-containing protein [Cohnella kolymensis]KIL35652.1 hypothetical protein SD71_12185 [Cohnella kolymensis]